MIDEKIIQTSIELNPIMANRGFTVHVLLSVECSKGSKLHSFFAQHSEVKIVFLTTGKAGIFMKVRLDLSEHKT